MSLACLLGGCHSVGPVTVPRDRLDYSTAIAESWKDQTLLNIVKLRYGDPPLFVDVGQIVGGYTLETSAQLGFTGGSSRSRTLGGGGRFTDRPTITYTPLTGNAFISGLVTPLAPASLLSAIEVGWPAEVILPIGVAAINGIANEDFVTGQYRPADPRFRRIVELIAQLQRSGLVSFRIVRQAENTASLLALGEPDADSLAAASELSNLLGLRPESNEISIVFGNTAANGSEIAIRTRSILNILQLMSARAELPEQHVADGRATAGVPEGANASLSAFRIHSSAQNPDDAFVAVNYRETWFYIDDRELNSKRLFSLLMLLFTLADTGQQRAGPVLTIPTG